MKALSVSIGDRSDAKRRADAAYRQRLYEAGRCVRCGRVRETDTKRCRRCTAKAAETVWQRRQRTRVERSRTVQGWNFETDDLITQHVRLAWSVALRIARQRPSHLDTSDLIGDALYGLVVAGRTYDPSYNVPFGAWATTRIRGAVYDGIKRWSHLGMQQPPVFVPLDEADSHI